MAIDSFGGKLPSQEFEQPVKVDWCYEKAEKILQENLRMDQHFTDCVLNIATARECYLIENNKLIRDCEFKCELEVQDFLNAYVELPEDHITLQQKFQDHIKPKTDFLREQCRLRLIRLHQNTQQDMSDQVQKYCGEVQDAMIERVKKAVMWEEMMALDQYQLLKRAGGYKTSNGGSSKNQHSS
jgi:hypothetical protein